MIATPIWIRTAFSDVPPELLDLQVLLEPFEEQLNLPPVPVEVCDFKSRKRQVVCEKRKVTVLLWIMESYQPEFFRILFEGCILCELNLRITENVLWQPPFPLDAPELQVMLRPDHEEGFQSVDSEKFRKCVVASVEHIIRAWLIRYGGHGLRVMHRRGGYVVERGDVRLQIVERVRLEASLFLSESRPSEHGKAQGDGCRIECVGLPLKHEYVRGAFSPCFSHHEEGKLLEDAVVAILVGHRERVS